MNSKVNLLALTLSVIIIIYLHVIHKKSLRGAILWVICVTAIGVFVAVVAMLGTFYILHKLEG